MENKDKILKRIKNLLDMANDVSSPQEAMIATKRARYLMDKYQIDRSDLKDTKFFQKGAGSTYRNLPNWYDRLAVLCARWNDCIVHRKYDRYNNTTLTFKGFKADVWMAYYFHEYLCEKINVFTKQSGVKGVGGHLNYKRGVVDELSNRINKLIRERKREFKSSDGFQLVPIKMGMVEAHFGVADYVDRDQRKLSHEEMEIYYQGRIDGRKIGLNPHLKGEAQTLLKQNS